MPTIAISNFVRRQTPEAPYSHFEGTWDELLEMVAEGVRGGWTKDGYKPGVMLVSVPPERFRSGTVLVTPETPLRAIFQARREHEARYLSVRAQGQKTQARVVFVVLYSHEVLGDEATTDCDWEIISINARETEAEEPMDPMTMARNFLVLPGGTKGDFTAQQFAESIIYWSTRALVDIDLDKSRGHR